MPAACATAARCTATLHAIFALWPSLKRQSVYGGKIKLVRFPGARTDPKDASLGPPANMAHPEAACSVGYSARFPDWRHAQPLHIKKPRSISGLLIRMMLLRTEYAVSRIA